MNTKFQKWLIDHKPSDNMVYKDAFWHTYCFLRDRILPMFTDQFYSEEYDYDALEKEIDENTDVVGEHRSKSIIHPVVRIVYKGVEIVFRYNFYNYEIAVISPKAIKLPMKRLFSSKKTSFFYQGFPEEYKIEEKYEDNNCKFIANVGDNYSFYTFMFLLRREIAQ